MWSNLFMNEGIYYVMKSNEECWLVLNVKMHALICCIMGYFLVIPYSYTNVYFLWWLEGTISVSSSMGCYVHITQVWIRVVLDVVFNVMMWFMWFLYILMLYCVKVKMMKG